MRINNQMMVHVINQLTGSVKFRPTAKVASFRTIVWIAGEIRDGGDGGETESYGDVAEIDSKHEK